MQYHLEDPKAYSGETIVVVGAGDSAIENALGLAGQNKVVILNRRDEFSRAKEGNLMLVLAAISDPDREFSCLYKCSPKQVQETPGADKPLLLTVDTPEGEQEIPCDRIIARLGAVPPRAFLDAAGIEFPSDKPTALPELSRQYESNVPGLYVVGSLAGYPLIKQAMNQGYDVIEFINGNDVKPADHPLLEYQFHALPFSREVDDVMEMFQRRIPMFSELNALAFRELVIESNVLVSYPAGELYDDAVERVAELARSLADREPPPRMSRVIREGETVFDAGEFGTSFFTIVDGEVMLEDPQSGLTTQLDADSSSASCRCCRGVRGSNAPCRCRLRAGGDAAPYHAEADELERGGARRYRLDVRGARAPASLRPECGVRGARRHRRPRTIRQYKAGEAVFSQGENGDSLHLVRSGGAKLCGATRAGVLVAQVRSGDLFGEMALMGDPVRRESATPRWHWRPSRSAAESFSR